MSQLALTTNPPARRRQWLRWGALGAVVLVPLAFAGLFVGALSGSDNALENIPAAIVNEDSLVTTTAADGTEQNVFAGRQLVTELTASDAEGFDWKITNADDAEEALANGEVYAILTVPSNFSKSILSISGDDPVKADIAIRTDDAHSYLGGAVAEQVGSTMAATFGNAITAQYITGLYSGLGDVGKALQTAADGAGELADGAEGLTDGIGSYSEGVDKYTGGVDSLAGGLGTLNTGAAGLDKLTAGARQYTSGISQLYAIIQPINAKIQAGTPLTPTEVYTLNLATQGLQGVSAQGASGKKFVAGVGTAVYGIQGGISKSASGAAQISGGSAALRSGATQLESGAAKLADGAGELSTGLADGAEAVPVFDEDTSKTAAEVASDPVAVDVTTDNAVTDVGQGIATFFVPLGLWIGALAVFLVLRPTTNRLLASTANNGRLVLASLVRAGIVTVAQALLLVVLLHVSLGVSWSLLPATLGFSLLMALAFTAFHYLLTIGFGRAGLVISLFLLAIQITSTGSFYPIELLAKPFQVISPFLPLSYGVSGMQGIISGGDTGSVILAAVALFAFGAGSVAVALFAMRRTRRAVSLGLVPVTA
ncbi:hypothetical protein EYE40_00695 [Glaciihabitans arcticus]|uniref:ABC-2 type transporter transmembrane domain-containing protein n=1 Tax=Glaciihabitans arcticus TaxID=2668039 RepID=A0A4Q9GMX4_9MICO|nr:YhgE/Pip domain-containing protein [Glaciihabitans arcticus]TBN56031.1 hypothetical protein EYE40_00695 [Glaciihabitans arcticus]